MFIPYNTDAPLYHPPFATVGTIVVNVLLFIPVFLHHDPYATEHVPAQQEEERDEDAPEPNASEIPLEDENGQPLSEEQRRHYQLTIDALNARRNQQPTEASSSAPPPTTVWRLMTLEFGKFRPWQWLTANYMHADLFHLLGNMFVLWGFGLVVEGKVGWWRFLAIYNLIGIVGWALVQFVMLFSDGGIGLGASLAIFGILVIALVWAPANEMQCVFMFGLRPILFEASIMTIAIGSVLLQLAISGLHIALASDMSVALRITSEVLHLIGAGLGFAIGVVMVKRSLVDCESWDMFSVMSGKHIKTISEDREDISEQLEKIKRLEQKRLAGSEGHVAAPLRPAPVNTQGDEMLNQFRQLVAAGKPLEAWTVFCRGEQTGIGWQVPEPDFVKYISVLRQQKRWDYAAGAMEEYLLRYFERETTIRLALAQVLVQYLHRPADARRVLEPVNSMLLSEKEKSTYDKLVAALA